jgi:hypothetical protein
MEVTIYFEHETGFDQIIASTTTAIPASITSGDYDITQDQREGVSFRGDGEFMMRISRIIPDFVSQSEDVIIKLDLRDYPNDTATTQTYTSTTTTNFIDTRARARQIALTISNTAISSNWKLGTFRLDVHSGGRR